MSVTHRYHARCSWAGSTGGGYERYRREHAASAPPAGETLTLSADEAFTHIDVRPDIHLSGDP